MFSQKINNILGSLVVIVTLCAPLSVNAAPVAFNIYNTGVNSSGLGLGGLARGAVDVHYDTALVTDPIVVSSGSYLANSATSQWIWANRDVDISTYTFKTTFDLTGFDASTAKIVGAWGADNLGLDILINGVSTGISLLSTTNVNYVGLHQFFINDNFVDGLNTLEFVIKNTSGLGAFRAELAGTANATVPEPGIFALFCVALVGLGLLRGRKSS